MVREFDMVGNSDLEPVRSVYDYPLEALLHVTSVNDVVEQELTYVGREFYQMLVPRLVASVTSGFKSSSIFFTDGSKGGAGTGFDVYHSGGLESSFRLREPSGVLTLEMTAIFVALIQKRARCLGRYLIVSRDRYNELLKGPAD
jgi:hypothetical protein